METKLKVLQKLRITLNLTLTVQNKINLMQKTTKFCNLITCPDPCGYSPTGTSFWNLSHQATNLQESFCKTSLDITLNCALWILRIHNRQVKVKHFSHF